MVASTSRVACCWAESNARKPITEMYEGAADKKLYVTVAGLPMPEGDVIELPTASGKFHRAVLLPSRMDSRPSSAFRGNSHHCLPASCSQTASCSSFSFSAAFFSTAIIALGNGQDPVGSAFTRGILHCEIAKKTGAILVAHPSRSAPHSGHALGPDGDSSGPSQSGSEERSRGWLRSARAARPRE